MARYIDADALMCQLDKKKAEVGKARYTDGFNDALSRVRSMVSSAPAVVLTLKMTGEWIPYELTEDDGYGVDFEEKIWYKCSVCNTRAFGRCYQDDWYSSPIRSKFCPSCGAKMKGFE